MSVGKKSKGEPNRVDFHFGYLVQELYTNDWSNNSNHDVAASSRWGKDADL